MICDYERNVLAMMHFGKMPDDPGAAFFAACESLRNNGYVANGDLTEKGRAALVISGGRRSEAHDQTMTELKSVRQRAQRSGLATAFAKKWVGLCRACLLGGHKIEGISPLKVYENVADS